MKRILNWLKKDSNVRMKPTEVTTYELLSCLKEGEVLQDHPYFFMAYGNEVIIGNINSQQKQTQHTATWGGGDIVVNLTLKNELDYTPVGVWCTKDARRGHNTKVSDTPFYEDHNYLHKELAEYLNNICNMVTERKESKIIEEAELKKNKFDRLREAFALEDNHA